jgi:hypothetical protein
MCTNFIMPYYIFIIIIIIIIIEGTARLRASNRVLRMIFGPKRDNVRVEWRKLRTEELHNCAPTQILFVSSD